MASGPSARCATLLRKERGTAEHRDHAITRTKQWREANRERYLDYARRYRLENETYDRDLYLKRTFGIGADDYERLLEAQGGKCAICETPPRAAQKLHVDHDHESGRIRGLLCMRCNNALGLLREDADVLGSAMGYVFRQDPDGLDELANERAKGLVGTGGG
jgi:Recombination endonuclease VII